MKLRYMKEQREQIRNALVNKTATSKKTKKFNLDSDSDDNNGDAEVYMGGKGGFSHKGKKFNMFEDDDFKDKINFSSEDEDGDPKDKGKLTEEFVNEHNFGGRENEDDYGNEFGEEEPKKKKSFKEVMEEIKEKSKAYRAMNKH
jgi:hypothetical protein